jgi:hypothetical protein
MCEVINSADRIFSRAVRSHVVLVSFIPIMFDLSPTYTNPIRRTKTSQRFQLGTDRGLPPPLEADEKAYLVELSGDDDPANAKNWAFSRKMIAALILGFDTLVASWGSSVYSAAVTPVSLEFGVGSVVSLLGLTLYICGFATGPLAFAPLSELYGRRYPITIAAFIFVSGTMFPLERLALTGSTDVLHVRLCHGGKLPDAYVMPLLCRCIRIVPARCCRRCFL